VIEAQPDVGLSLAFASHFLLDALPHWDYPTASIPAFANEDRTSCEIRSEKAEERREHDGTGFGNDDVAARHLEKAPASNWAQFLPRDHALWLGHNGRGATHSG
jgi:hypothetical protein